MKGAARVFAGELDRTTFSLPARDAESSPEPVSPTGACCGNIYLAGALLEVRESGKDFLRARIADPTGAFEISAGRSQADAAAVLRKLSPPCFVTVTGSARIFNGNGRSHVLIAPDSVMEVNREIRDLWIAETADCTLQRISGMQNLQGDFSGQGASGDFLRHYSVNGAYLREILEIVETAFASIRPVQVAEESGEDEAREAIIEIIRQNSGPRGISVDDLTAKAGERGISSETVLSIVRTLVEEDECYQPQKGMVKLL